MTILRLLKPRMTVAVYARRRLLFVERGRSPSPSGPELWALVGIPPHATKENIARTLAELCGLDQVPFFIDLFVRA